MKSVGSCGDCDGNGDGGNEAVLLRMMKIVVERDKAREGEEEGEKDIIRGKKDNLSIKRRSQETGSRLTCSLAVKVIYLSIRSKKDKERKIVIQTSPLILARRMNKATLTTCNNSLPPELL